MRREDGAGYIGESECKDWLRAWMWRGREDTGVTPMSPALKSDCQGPKPKHLMALESSVSYLIDL